MQAKGREASSVQMCQLLFELVHFVRAELLMRIKFLFGHNQLPRWSINKIKQKINKLCKDAPIFAEETDDQQEEKRSRIKQFFAPKKDEKTESALRDVKKEQKTVEQIFSELDMQPTNVDLNDPKGNFCTQNL